MSAARDVLRDRCARIGARAFQRLDDGSQREREVRARVAVGYGVDVQVVDPATVRFEVLERAARARWRTASSSIRSPDPVDDHELLTFHAASLNGAGD